MSAIRLSAPVAGSAAVSFRAVRDQLVLDHLGLVKGIASRLAQGLPPQVEVADLVGVGVLGLLDAASRFNPALGVPFSAFARRRIHGAMLDWLRGLDWAPRALRRLRRDVDTATANLRVTLGREPRSADIAQALDVAEGDYDKMLDKLKSAELATIRQCSADEDGRGAHDMESDPADGPHARLERAELRKVLGRTVATLPERDRQILALYYEDELTLAQIGRVIGVGESRVSQLRTQAIARLRASMLPAAGLPGVSAPTAPTTVRSLRVAGAAIHGGSGGAVATPPIESGRARLHASARERWNSRRAA